MFQELLTIFNCMVTRVRKPREAQTLYMVQIEVEKHVVSVGACRWLFSVIRCLYAHLYVHFILLLPCDL